MKPAARYSIERLDKPESGNRFLAVTDEGGLGWTSRFTAAAAFRTKRAARDFVTHRMGAAAETAVIVRHTIH